MALQLRILENYSGVRTFDRVSAFISNANCQLASRLQRHDIGSSDLACIKVAS
jgi:hypothetical protein